MRHKSLADIVIAAAVALILGLLAVPAVRAGVMSSPGTCTGTLGPVTVPGNLTVPPGATCTLNGTKVTGNVIVSPGATLITENGVTIGGAVTANRANLIQLNDATITGSVSITGTATTPSDETPKNTICNTTIRGSLSVTNGSPNSVFLIGDLPADNPCDGADMITGSVILSGNRASTQLSNNQIGGSVTVTNNGGASMTDDLEFDIAGNMIGGSLSCTGNVPAPDQFDIQREPNTARGAITGQCVPSGAPFAPLRQQGRD